MKFGVIVFPGSNCDHDAYHVVSKHVGQPVDFIWHKETDLSGYDAVIARHKFQSLIKNESEDERQTAAVN